MGGSDSQGQPNGSYMGFRLWHHPGAFHNGFKGLCSTFVTAAFAFAGTELVGLAAAETENPRKTLPTAIKQVPPTPSPFSLTLAKWTAPLPGVLAHHTLLHRQFVAGRYSRSLRRPAPSQR